MNYHLPSTVFALSMVLASPSGAEVPVFRHAAHGDRACTDCHRLARGDARRLAPAPGGGHHPCTDCHAEQWRAASTWTPFCVTCHRLDDRGRPRSARFWAARPRGKGDFVLAGFDHAGHARATGCGECHRGPSRADGFARPGHVECAKCHGGDAQPAMSACAGCHVPGAGGAPAASTVADPYRVDRGFDHRRHARHGAACGDCHPVEVAVGAAVPRPPKVRCARCHDGGAAFAVTGHACGRCHVARE